jgi:hypothetical protein
MKLLQEESLTHLVGVQTQQLLRQANGSFLRLALTVVLVVVGAYLYLIPNSIIVRRMTTRASLFNVNDSCT